MQVIEDLSVDFASRCFQAKIFYGFRELVKLKLQTRSEKKAKNAQAEKLHKLSILNEFKRSSQVKKHHFRQKIVNVGLLTIKLLSPVTNFEVRVYINTL